MEIRAKRGRVATVEELRELQRLRAAVLQDKSEGRAMTAWLLREQARQMKEQRAKIMRELLMQRDETQARIDD